MSQVLQHHRVYFMQFAMALSLGALLSRLPDLQLKFGLTEGELGLLLVALSSGVLLGMTFTSRLVEALGARTTAILTVFMASGLYALVPWMPSALAAAPLLFTAGLFQGAFEINANIETDRREALLGYRIMSRTHGMWSLGFFATALFGAVVRQASMSIELHLFIVVVAVAITGSLVFSKVENAPKRPGSYDGNTPLVALPTIGLLPLCLVGAAPLLCEGAGIDWSAIYMRDVFAVEPFVGGLSVTIFSLAIAFGRLTMDPVVDHFGPRSVAILSLGVAVIGLIMIASARYPVIALLGFGLAGIGCSCVYPLAVSAAAQRTDGPASINVAALGQVTFVVFFAGPPLLGFVAEHFGIRFSYWVVVPVIVAALFTTKALNPPMANGVNSLADHAAKVPR